MLVLHQERIIGNGNVISMHKETNNIEKYCYLFESCVDTISRKNQNEDHKLYRGNCGFLLLVWCLTVTTLCSQEICEITSYQEFPWEELGAKNTDQKIFMFDIDGTLIRTDVLNTIYTTITTQPYESVTQLWSSLSGGRKKGILDLGTRYEQSSLISESIPSMIDTLIDNGHIVWNYTNVYTGKLYDTTYEERIVHKLDKVHIKRSPILIDNQTVERVDFPIYGEAYPVLYNMDFIQCENK